MNFLVLVLVLQETSLTNIGRDGILRERCLDAILFIYIAGFSVD